MGEITVHQWSFCSRCKGAGLKSCPECEGKGTVATLIPLDSLPKFMRSEYTLPQADFIRKQRENQVA